MEIDDLTPKEQLFHQSNSLVNLQKASHKLPPLSPSSTVDMNSTDSPFPQLDISEVRLMEEKLIMRKLQSHSK
jgi:hypothetical protein